MSRRAPFVLALLLLAACGDEPGMSESDEVWGQRACTGDAAVLRVWVEDASGAPVEGAELSATHFGSERSLLAVTGPDGTTDAVTSELGEGSVLLQASSGGLRSELGAVLFTCTPCSCAAEPSGLTLRLSP